MTLKERIEEVVERIYNQGCIDTDEINNPEKIPFDSLKNYKDQATTDILKAIDEAGYHKHERINLDCSIEDMKEKMK